MKTKYLLHRCNTPEAIAQAAQVADGFECDVRLNAAGVPVLAHDPEELADGMNLSAALRTAGELGLVVAINVKEHRQAVALRSVFAGLEFQAIHVPCYFVFDVPGVEIPLYNREGLIFYARVSEYETQYSQHGILVDSFSGAQQTLVHRCHGSKPLALISQGCHGRWPNFVNTVNDDVTYLICKLAEIPEGYKEKKQ